MCEARCVGPGGGGGLRQARRLPIDPGTFRCGIHVALTNRLHGRYGLTLFERHASIKAALGEMLAEWPHIQAVVVGARRTDPYYGMSPGRGVCMSVSETLTQCGKLDFASSFE
jgi:RNase H-fold protein (predicted Holliday junction resolvase)